MTSCADVEISMAVQDWKYTILQGVLTNRLGKRIELKNLGTSALNTSLM